MKKSCKPILQSNKKESVNKILYVGLVLFLIGIFLFLVSNYGFKENNSNEKFGIVLIGFVVTLFGLICIYRWIMFWKKGIKYFSQLPRYETWDSVAPNYSKYAGWSSV